MAEQRRKKEKNFLVQGSILAIAGVITKIIGAVYRIPLTNIAGAEGIGYYSVAFSIYSVALMLTSYSLPLAVSKLVSALSLIHIYGMLYQLILAGKFEEAAGVIIGSLTDCDIEGRPGSAEAMVREVLGDLQIPVVLNVRAGHILSLIHI